MVYMYNVYASIFEHTSLYMYEKYIIKAYKFNVKKLKERVFQLIQKQGHTEVYFIFNVSCLFIIKQCGVFRSSCSG